MNTIDSRQHLAASTHQTPNDDAHSSAPERFADPRRLSNYIKNFAEVTSEPGTITRLAYTPAERDAHAVFAAFMEERGLTVTTDPAGNTIAEHPGRERYFPAVGTGSHLDSVPSAGAFDGTAGIAAAMEVVDLLTSNNIKHRHPFRFVAFAAEEGARFGQACIGSRFAAGMFDESALVSRHDKFGVSLADAMRSVGMDPNVAVRNPWNSDEWAAFVEVHIEQGAVLETVGAQIGVVDLVSGSTRLQLKLSGRASHTGATPMALRSDTLVAAAEIILIAESVATDAQHRGTRASVGQIEIQPGSITTIPGRASLSLDVRDVDSDRQRMAAIEIVRRARAVCDRRRVGLSLVLLGDTSPVVLPIWLRLLTASVCREKGLAYRVITSGASHDSQLINTIAPAAILFVPSRNGLSHVPEEWTSMTDLACGTDTLLSTLLRIDEELIRLSKIRSALRPTLRTESKS